MCHDDTKLSIKGTI